jgi:hypothetical protein
MFNLGNKGVCYGDSGGGLYVYDSNISKYVVVGIVSYGIAEACALPGYPELTFFLCNFMISDDLISTLSFKKVSSLVLLIFTIGYSQIQL